MKIAEHSVVSIDYTLTDPEGQVLDTSEGRGPLSYLHGAGGLIPGLEQALEGLVEGDELSIDIKPEDAYGLRDESLVTGVPRNAFPPDVQIEAGMQFQAQRGEQVHLVRVVGVEGEEVTIDANHPLAGMPLHFEVAVVTVRAATQEELDHGHAHGAGGHHHH